jgi:transposase
VEVPCGPKGQPLLLEEVWATLHPAAQAVMVALAQQVAALTVEVRDLKARLGQNSSNSSRSPSSDPPQARGRPPTAPSGRRPGGQPGHVAHQRGLTAPERVDAVVDHWPARCAGCGAWLDRAAGATGGAPGDFVPHQVRLGD